MEYGPVVPAFLAGVMTWALTALGASTVFLFKSAPTKLNYLTLGFAAGVMTSASFWSLILPALEMSETFHEFKWLPVSLGFVIGVFFLRIVDYFLPHIHPYFKEGSYEGLRVDLKKYTLLFLAMTLHNIPEGLAIGVSYAASFLDPSNLSHYSPYALAFGIGLQNLPEGMAVTFPLRKSGLSNFRSFLYGQFSGAVEPVFALIGAIATSFFSSALPYVMGFAAGTMIYVVIEDLIPESQSGGNTDIPTLGFMTGFLLMMILDLSLG
ncbi:MAG: ZIP family metal transporter [Desulfobacterota bacterium]|nr:ZIP family metal transporter [Thermodesulfobacteriota bacterium]MDW8002644.1 ZIP family metal transporter [Deltaproteobacteria bacterium]